MPEYYNQIWRAAFIANFFVVLNFDGPTMEKIWAINDIPKPLSELRTFAFPIPMFRTVAYLTHMTKPMQHSLYEQ